MTIKVKFSTLFLIAIIVLLSNRLFAATINALSCNQTDVGTAINAASDGDIVTVPSGTCVWSSGLAFTKAITLQGAGIDKTIIKNGLTNGTPLIAKISLGKNVRITGFTFDASTGTDTWGLVQVTGGTQSFRVDHCKFTNLYKRGISVAGNATYGVIDNCTFELKANTSVQGVTIFPNDGAAAWLRDYTPGSANAVYIEDCTFNYDYMGDGALDAYQGARFVFRHNTVNGTVIGWHGYDSDSQSTHTFEVYNNTFNKVYRDVFIRGGTGVIFNNIFPAGATIEAIYYRTCYDPTNTWGTNLGGSRCDGTQSVDGNQSGQYGYPCYRQPGMTGTNGITSSPIYVWGNVAGGSTVGLTLSNPWPLCTTQHSPPQMSTHIQENRDYYNKTSKPGYAPYTYPHPLTLSSQTTDATLAAPKNLRTQ